jgi:hypothetical protein
MGLMSDKASNDFRISVSSKSVAELKTLFNKLNADSENCTKSDHARGIAAEKAGIVKGMIAVRRTGGFQG